MPAVRRSRRPRSNPTPSVGGGLGSSELDRPALFPIPHLNEPLHLLPPSVFGLLLRRECAPRRVNYPITIKDYPTVMANRGAARPDFQLVRVWSFLGHTSNMAQDRRPHHPCHYRKSTPDVLVVQSSEMWGGHDAANSLNSTRHWCVLVQR